MATRVRRSSVSLYRRLYPDDDALGVTAKGGVEEGRCSRTFRKRTLAHQERRSRDFGRTCLRWRSEAKAGNCRALREWCATSASVTRQKRSCGAAACSAVVENARRNRPLPASVSGEFDHITDANDAFLHMVGYSREDLVAGRLYWPDLTPAEYLPLDEEAHEEGMRYGACTPFEKEYIRKDGTRVSVLVAVAVLNLSPFRWMTIVQTLTGGEGRRKSTTRPRATILRRLLAEVRL